MADIDTPQVRQFCNERVRKAANLLAQLYNWSRSVRDEWTAQDMASQITNSPDDTIIDGAATDGRPPLTGEDVHNIKDLVVAFIADLEANTNAELNEILRVAPKPTRGIMD